MKTHPLTPSTVATRPSLQRPFRRLILFVSVLTMALTASAVTLPYYDGFDYSEGALHTVGTPTWFTSSGGVEVGVSNAAALTAPAGYPAATGKGVRRSSSGTSRRAVVQFTQIPATDGNVMYASFLLNVQTAPSAAVVFAHMDDGSASAGSPQCGIFVDSSSKLGVAINNSAPQFTMANGLSAGTHLVVVKYTFQSGNDRVDLWVDPLSTDYGAGTAPASLGAANNANPTTPLEYLHIVAPSSGGGTVFFDELRLGTNWADVVPAGGPLVGAKLGFTTQPAGAAPNATLSPVVVQVQTAGGAAVASNGVPVTLALSAGSGTLNGTLTQNTDSSGKATFSNLSVDTVGTGKQLTASASGIGTGLTNAVSTTFTIANPSVATKLAFTAQPTDTQVSAVMSSVVVQVQDASSVAVSTNGVPVTLNLSSGTGTLNGTLTQNTDGTGKATFNNLSVDTIGTSKQLTASAAGLTDATSSTFAITSGGGGGSPGLNISQTRMVPSGYEVKGTNGTPVTFAQIIGSPNLTLPLTNWLLVAYGNLDGSGNITFTNPTSIAMPLAYYRLRTGNAVTKLEPPSIPSGSAPQSQIVSPGATATFTVTGTGPLLQYLWLFNGAPIKNATNSILVIPNAQAGNVGNYQVIIANPGGSVTSPIATLGVGNVGPTITSHPQDQTVNAGSSAIFNVTATGTIPLTYQWYFNTNTLLSGRTNSTLNLAIVSTNDAGKYACTVANGYGSVGSSNANLTVTPTPTGLPDTNVIGWAAYAGVTGGSLDGATASVTCSNYASLSNAVRQAAPLTIYVQGTITNTETYCYIYGNNKTIIGLGTNAAFMGDLRAAATNIIIRNLYFSARPSDTKDLVTLGTSSSGGTAKYVWVDHCTFYDAPDGSIDITEGADYITISWCKFSYAYAPPGTTSHEYVNLIAKDDSDSLSNYHVTFHHNWYGDGCRERMPSVRFGRVHVFNNYYNCTYNNYCVRTRIDAEVLVQNNYFIGVQNPWERFITSGADGKLYATNNITNNCTFISGWVSGAVVTPGTNELGSELNPPLYPFTPDPAADVPYYIQAYSGNGKYPFGP